MRGESWRREERPHHHRERVGALPSRALRLALPLLASLALILVWGLAAVTLTAVPAARAVGNGTVQIVTPQPDSNNNAQGPVGAYVTINAQSLNTQDSYVIGVGIAPGGCSAQFISATTQPVVPDQSGNLVTTFTWPSAANAVGSSYYVCVQDTSQSGSPSVQSTDVYIVRAGSKPSIAIAAAQQGGTPQGSNRYYAGSQITITGTNFVPGGQPLAVHLLSGLATDPNELQSAPQLSPTDNSTITADNNGGFSTTVTLPVPQVTLPAKFYVYVVSQDAQSGTYPSLIADKAITIVQQPAPTPTVTVAPPTPTVILTPPGGTGNGNGGDGPHHVKSVIGLGVISVLLFVIGVILLASAASMPRPQQ